MERKNFYKTIKLHKVCNEDTFRPAFAYIHFEDGYAYATNGSILVKAKLTDIIDIDDLEMLERLDGKNLHFKQYENLLKYDVITEITDIAISAKTEQYETSFKFNDKIKFPNVQKIFGSFYSAAKSPIDKIAFNPSQIEAVAKVMPLCSRGMVFEFGEHANAAVLLCYPKNGLYKDICAVIMPMCCNE